MAASRRRKRRSRHSQNIPWLEDSFRLLRNPLPPVNWLTPPVLEDLHLASLRVLEEVGIAFMEAEALDLWQTAGADVDRDRSVVRIPRELLLSLVAKAPSSFSWLARNPDHSLVIGGNHICFSPVAGAPYVSDLRRGRREATLADYGNFVSLAQMIPYFHSVGGQVVEPQDVPPSLRHLKRLWTTVINSDKCFAAAGHGRVIPKDVMHMMRILFGDPLPGVVTGTVINVTSPLRLDARMIGGIIEFARNGQATIITPFIMAGASSPITMAAALAQQNAEALAGIALAQLTRPGAPVVYGGFAQNVDMRSGAPAFGGPEGAWGVLVAAQLARRYQLPFRASGCLTNSPAADAQAATESHWSLWPTVLAHTNIIYHSAGWLEAGLVASYEKFMLDSEALGMMARFLQGFATDVDSIGLEAIRQVGIGGHHFGTNHTRQRFRDAFFQPAVGTRLAFERWAAEGTKNATVRAAELWPKLLSQFEPPVLDAAVREELQEFIARRERQLANVDLYAET